MKPFYKWLVTVVVAIIVAGSAWEFYSSRLPREIYTTCKFDDGLSVMEVTQIYGNRTVETKVGPTLISRSNGYRVMFAYPNTDYFVNLHVDKSYFGAFTIDKENIIAQMEHREQSLPLSVTNKMLHGFDTYAIDDVPNAVIGWYSMFDDRTGVTLTAYFLNQHPERRKFQSLSEYHELRDRFLDKYLSCVRENEAK